MRMPACPGAGEDSLPGLQVAVRLLRPHMAFPGKEEERDKEAEKMRALWCLFLKGH